MSKTWKTPGGTELRLMDFKGKDYMEVSQRLIWFREEHPDWEIHTEFLVLEEKRTIARATVMNEQGRVIGQAAKTETASGFPDHQEKAETGAVGRALALCGYGTQFAASELEEGARVVDSPQPGRPSAARPGSAPQRPTAPVQATKQPDIPDGSRTVTVAAVKRGQTEGKAWERVSTGDGAAWNNSDLPMQEGAAYDVTVSGGRIIGASRDRSYDAVIEGTL